MRRGALALVAALGVFAGAGGARAQNGSAPAPSASAPSAPAPSAPAPSASGERRAVDSIAVRFYAPETGGPGRPLFVTERVLAFESRVEALAEAFHDAKAPYLERHARAALEHHVAEEMLARLPLEPSPPPAELEKMIADLVAALVTRLGGPPSVAIAADAEGMGKSEVDAIFRRQARAAIYIDRFVSPILKPSDDQLREVYRSAAHPYRSLTFAQAHGELEKWFVAERIRVAESAYLQTARTRVKIVAVAR